MDTKNQLSDAEKIRFADMFLDKFFSLGFGTLPKREVDILIFHILIHHTSLFKAMSNYEMSNQLKISESRIRSLLMDANLKHQQMNHQEALRQIAFLFFEAQRIRPEIEGDMVQFELEDPVLQREFDHAVRLHGSYTDSSFKSSIVKVKTSVFLKIFILTFEDVENKFVELEKEIRKDEKRSQDIVKKAYSIDQRIEWFVEENKGKISIISNILAPIVSSISK